MSMTTNKQAPVQRYANYGVDMMEWAEGGYVKYDDYQSLLDELKAAEKRIAELEAREVALPDYTKLYKGPFAMEVEHQVKQALAAAGITTKGE